PHSLRSDAVSLMLFFYNVRVDLVVTLTQVVDDLRDEYVEPTHLGFCGCQPLMERHCTVATPLPEKFVERLVPLQVVAVLPLGRRLSFLPVDALIASTTLAEL